MRSRQSLERPIFGQRGISRPQLSLCYAKIAPAGLHRGDFDGAIANTPKLLERYRNPSCAILFESSSAPVAPMM
jgi:hypothetical protein